MQIAYKRLLQCVGEVRAHLAKSGWGYHCGNISPGYMDYTYFPFFDATLRENQLRFGMVLNHARARFELWLMGQNAQVQKAYWARLKDTRWNCHRTKMPQYAVLEAVLVEQPDFDDFPALLVQLKQAALQEVAEIVACLRAAE